MNSITATVHKHSDQTVIAHVTVHKHLDQTVIAHVTVHKHLDQTVIAHVTVHIKCSDFYSDSRPSYFIGDAAVTNNLNTMSKTRQNVLGH